MIEFKVKIEISLDDVEEISLTGFIQVENGKILSSEDAQERFFKAIRVLENTAPDLERTYLIDNLTTAQEQKLQAEHAENGADGVLDDDMEDSFESWLEDLRLEELNEIIK